MWRVLVLIYCLNRFWCKAFWNLVWIRLESLKRVGYEERWRVYNNDEVAQYMRAPDDMLEIVWQNKRWFISLLVSYSAGGISGSIFGGISAVLSIPPYYPASSTALYRRRTFLLYNPDLAVGVYLTAGWFSCFDGMAGPWFLGTPAADLLTRFNSGGCIIYSSLSMPELSLI